MRPDGPIPARVMIVGEAPGEEEVRQGTPFVGASGMELNRMLTEAGMSRSECFVTNVARTRPPQNDIDNFIARTKKERTSEHRQFRDKWVKEPIISGCLLLGKEIDMVKPNIIIALGNTPLWALTGLWGITRWRGSMLYSDLATRTKLIPTYHPAAILRQWDWRAIAVHDLKRAGNFRGGNPYPEPDYRFRLRPTVQHADDTLSMLLRRLSSEQLYLSVDIETSRGHIDCIGLAWSTKDAICIPFTEGDEHYWTEEEECFIVRKMYFVLTHVNVRCIMQNGLYDCQYIYRHWHYIPRVAQDTMISHHVAFAGLPKKLDFQASMYCEHYVQWKPDRSKQKEGG